MFDRLLFWLREKARLLFGENTTVSASVSNSMENAIILWAQMYDTGGPWCHGGKNALHSLKLAQSVASELARLTTLEMECIVSGSARADSINTMLQPFIADLRTPVEYGCALGGILFRPFLDAEGRIQIDAVQGDCFCPTRFDSSGRMTGAIFYDHLVRGNRIYTRLEDHEFSGSTYSITVKAFRSMTSTDLGIEVPLTDVPEFNDFKFQIEVVPGTTVPTTYTPYTGQTATLTLPCTIYGGTVDAVTGEGQNLYDVLTLTGEENWKKDDTYIVLNSATTKTNIPLNGVCSHFLYRYNYGGDSLFVDTFNIYLGATMAKKYALDEWKALLAAQYAAGTPVQICYKLAEPVPITATGAQPIPALSGLNTVLTNADSVAVTGRADPIKRITDLEDAVASMTTT